jgi:hypothetical protein
VPSDDEPAGETDDPGLGRLGSSLADRRAAIVAELCAEHGFPGLGDCSMSELTTFIDAARRYLDAAGVPPLLDRLARLSGIEADRDRWRGAWTEERRERVAAETATSTAATDALRIRDAARLALDELLTDGRPPAKAIADATQTLANALEGRPLAASRDGLPARPGTPPASGARGPLSPGVAL